MLGAGRVCIVVSNPVFALSHPPNPKNGHLASWLARLRRRAAAADSIAPVSLLAPPAPAAGMFLAPVVAEWREENREGKPTPSPVSSSSPLCSFSLSDDPAAVDAARRLASTCSMYAAFAVDIRSLSLEFDVLGEG